EAGESSQKRAGADQRVAVANTALETSETTFGDLTGALADLSARRNQLEEAIRSHGERRQRLEGEIATVEAELKGLDAGGTIGPKIAGLAKSVEHAQSACADAEAQALRAEAAHSAARQAPGSSRTTRNGRRGSNRCANTSRRRRSCRAGSCRSA